MRKFDISFAALVAALGWGFADAALAQQQSEQFARDRNVSVRDRSKPEYDAQGIAAGSFRFYPELVLAPEYTDNVFAVDTGEQEDIVYNINPKASLRSNFANHELNFLVEAPTRLYAEYDEQDATDVHVGVDGRLDVYRDFNIFGSADYGDLTEPLSSSPSAIALREPVEYIESRAELGLSKVFNRARITVKGASETIDYDDGVLVNLTPVDQDHRDRVLSEAEVRLDYAVGPSTALFFSARGNERDYDLQPPDVLVGRDSEGYTVLVGANFDVTRLVAGEIGIGYLEQSYDDVAAEDTTGLAVSTNLEWYPDELLTVSFGASRAVDDAGVADATSYIANDASLGIDYEFRRNVILGVRYDYSVDEYEGIDREDTRWGGSFEIDYAVNRGVSFFVEAGHYEQTSEGLQAGREYVINRGLIGLKLRR
jgi:hypothetical protein